MEQVFDLNLLAQRKVRALAQHGLKADFLIARAAEDLADRLSTVERRFSKAAVVFSGTSHASQALMASGKVEHVVRVETCRDFLDGQQGIVAAAETLPLDPESIDLAVSLLSLHEANDVPGLLLQIRRALRPDGLFLAAIPGNGTLAELRDSLLAAETEIMDGASPRVSPFLDVRDAGALLQRAGFALPVADVEKITVRYPHMFALMADLRAMGATNALVARSRRPVPRGFFQRAAQIYAERYADSDGRIRASFSTVWMSGWAPHASQQKPLKPGSASMSLHDVLGRSEEK